MENDTIYFGSDKYSINKITEYNNMKTKKKKMGNVGIRLKPKEPNLLENYSRYRKNRTRKKKKKTKKTKKPKVRKIHVERRVDPMKKIIDDSEKHDKSSIKGIDIQESPESEESPEPEEKKTIEIKKKDLSDTDPNIKKILVDNIEEEIKKKGSGIKME
tara:strand:- start:81 stop:557 length:477 start_codon:yes stop_codon:yes gene_type:complete